MQLSAEQFSEYVALLSGLVTIGVAIAMVRLNSRNAKTQEGVAAVQGAAEIIKGYKELNEANVAQSESLRRQNIEQCEAFTRQVGALNGRIAENERKIDALERALEESRGANRELQERIVLLEEENGRLHAEVERLTQCQKNAEAAR